MIFLSLKLEGQIVNIPDVNFKAVLLQASPSNQIAQDLSGNYFKIDANNDGEIQDSEAQQVSFLMMVTTSINSLVGITSFTNLKVLRCNSNNLTTLDVQGMSKLEQLYCSQNQLTSLNVQGLQNLKYVYCGQNNLTTLNLQGLSNLIWIECPMNNLTTLDLHNLPNLENVSCFGNDLASLNVLSSPKINFIHCAENQLSNLTINHLTNLKTLSCFGNNLTDLNVANLNKLEFLEFSLNNISSIDLTGLVALKVLQFSNNHISTINLQGLNLLETLSCGWNNLSTVNVSTNPNLISIDCRNNQLTSLYVKNGTYQAIQLSGNPQLNYICADPSEVTQIQNLLAAWGYTSQIDTSCALSVADSMVKKSELSFYPNPVDDILNISIDQKIKNLYIYDASGKRIKILNDPGNKIYLRDLNSGIYILNIVTESGNYQTKFIKK